MTSAPPALEDDPKVAPPARRGRSLPGPGASPGEVRAMFASIAPRYDLGNRVLSFGRDGAWRRAAARAAEIGRGSVALDLCTGTGDLAFALERTGAAVVGVDFCLPMVERARRKAAVRGSSVRFALGDALSLPFPEKTFEAATIGFGLRNLSDPARGLAEVVRVLRPGGRFVVLEFCDPGTRAWGRLVRSYYRTWLPRVGGWLTGNRAAYGYLPRTALAFADAGALARALESGGAPVASVRRLAGGVAAVVVGVRR